MAQVKHNQAKKTTEFLRQIGQGGVGAATQYDNGAGATLAGRSINPSAVTQANGIQPSFGSVNEQLGYLNATLAELRDRTNTLLGMIDPVMVETVTVTPMPERKESWKVAECLGILHQEAIAISSAIQRATEVVNIR